MAISEAEPKEEPIKPKRKYKKRALKPKGDGTLRIKKAPAIAPARRKAALSFSITYEDKESLFKSEGDTKAELQDALAILKMIIEREGE